MTKDQFIDKYQDIIIQFYMDEGRSLDYDDDQLYDYAGDAICFTLVGTKDEIEDELAGKEYAIIAQDGEWFAVETFHGIMYDDVTL